MEKIWLKHYPNGIPAEINPDSYPTLVSIFEESFRKFPDLPAFENFGKRLTYRDVDELSEGFAAYLIETVGVKKGDRFCVHLPNILQFPVAMFGAMRAGCIITNANPLYTARELQHQLKDAEVKVILTCENFAATVQQILPEVPSLHHVLITGIGDMVGGLKGFAINMVLKYVKKMIPPYHIPGSVRFMPIVSSWRGKSVKLPQIQPEDVAFLQYTGGTTGLSKGATLSNRNVCANIEQMFSWIGANFVDGKEVIVTPLPLYHIFGLAVNCLAIMRVGGRNVLITNPRDIPGFIKEMRKQQITIFTGVNTLFKAMMEHPDFSNIDFSQLKLSVGGAVAVQEVVAKKWESLTGKPLIEAYGMSETSPAITANPLNGKHKINTIGLPLPSTEVSLLDDDGNEVQPGQPGEICVKGPQVMKGYWNKEEENKKAFINGWFRTGDMAVMDNDGFFRIVDRKKEMILVSGFNVYPNEVEHVLSGHPKVLDVGVIGVPDEKTTEAVKAYIIKRDETLTAEEVIEFSRKSLTNYKVPRQIQFVKELPKTPVGKILRRVLKEMHQKGT